MKILIDEVKKEGVLVKNDGTEISRYSYKNLIDEEFTLEDFKKDIDDRDRRGDSPAWSGRGSRPSRCPSG